MKTLPLPEKEERRVTWPLVGLYLLVTVLIVCGLWQLPAWLVVGFYVGVVVAGFMVVGFLDFPVTRGHGH